MDEFLKLIGQILIIALLQSIIEVFIEPGNKPYLYRIINIACYVGALYLLVDYIANSFFKEFMSLIRF